MWFAWLYLGMAEEGYVSVLFCFVYKGQSSSESDIELLSLSISSTSVEMRTLHCSVSGLRLFIPLLLWKLTLIIVH